MCQRMMGGNLKTVEKVERLKFSAEGEGRKAEGQGESCIERFWVSASSIRYYTEVCSLNTGHRSPITDY